MAWKNVLDSISITAIEWATSAGLRLVIAVVLMLVSFKVVNIISKKIEKGGESGRVDKTLSRTFAYAFRLTVKFLILICLIGFVGIDTSGLAALAVSLGAGVGLALNGALSNFAGGILIILTRPFRVDDFIEAKGYLGTVEDIHITTTKLRTPDNKVVYIPNGPLSSDTIVNYSIKSTRRVDLKFSVGYSEDFERAKAVIMQICASHPLVISDPEPTVRVSAHGQSGIEIIARVWVSGSDYWTVNYDLLESVKSAFDNEGIEIPYDRMDVRLRRD